MSGKIDPEAEQTNKASNFIGQSYLAYQLLDMLVWCYGWPDHPSNPLLPPVSPPVAVLFQYAMVMDKFSHPELLPAGGITTPPPSSVPLSELPDRDTPLAIKAIRHLCLAVSYTRTMDDNDVKSVLHAVACIVSCFRPVSVSHGYIAQLTQLLQSEFPKLAGSILSMLDEYVPLHHRQSLLTHCHP